MGWNGIFGTITMARTDCISLSGDITRSLGGARALLEHTADVMWESSIATSLYCDASLPCHCIMPYPTEVNDYEHPSTSLTGDNCQLSPVKLVKLCAAHSLSFRFIESLLHRSQVSPTVYCDHDGVFAEFALCSVVRCKNADLKENIYIECNM